MQLLRMHRTGFFAILITVFLLIPAAVQATAADGMKRYPADLFSIQSSREGLQATIAFIDAHPEIFPPTEVQGTAHQLNREQRMVAWQTWQAFLDHILFFDSMGHLYGEIYDRSEGKSRQAPPFYAAFASFLAQYRFALDFIERMERNPNMHILLNEPVPELGLEEGTYASLKYRFLNVLRGAEFARLNVLYLYFQTAGPNPLQEGMDEDIRVIWEAGKGKGPNLTAQNALRIVGDLGFTTWFPVQKNTAVLMGNIKVWRPDITLISTDQIRELSKLLQPGDILLQRREWFGSNIGIPGFWTHAALYIGTPEQRNDFFTDPSATQWLKQQGSADGTLDNLLKAREPDHYRLSIVPDEGNHVPRILEAIGEGVSFSSLEHSAAADSLAVLRPNIPQQAIAQALLRAFHYSGRPYDFNFDFRTDSELVCSELVYKAYETTAQSNGLNLPLTEVMGRPLISPNNIAKLFDQEYDRKKRQLELIVFLDGNEEDHKAVLSTTEAFRQSWKRPKWHIWIQNTEAQASGKPD